MTDTTQHRLQPGDTAPAFTLQDQEGRPVSLRDSAGKHTIVYFYPAASTPGCTTQACDFRDSLASLTAAGYVVLGISPDPIGKIIRFAEQEGLTFPLLSDEDHAVAEAYGVWVEKSMYGRRYMGMERSSFLVDAEGRIARVWRKVKPEAHAAEVLEAARALGGGGAAG